MSAKTGVGHDIMKGRVKPRPKTTRAASTSFSEATNSAFWKLISDGDYVYGARGISGMTIVDVSNPSNPSETFSSLIHQTDETTTKTYRCMGIAKTGNVLITCARSGAYETTGIGYLETWDITTPGTTTVHDVYTKNATDALEASPHLYSAVATDGASRIFVSGQKSGFWEFDISTPTAITPNGSVTAGDWETQGLCYHPVGGTEYCFVANYGYGVVSVNVNTAGAPAEADRIAAYAGGPNGDTLRPWDCVGNGDYLFCSANTSDATGDSEDRGLLVVDISDPTNMSYVGYCQIPPSLNATDLNEPDRVLLGIAYKDGFVYLANGDKGTLAFDVSEPTNPTFAGVVCEVDSGDSAYAVTVHGNGTNKTLVTGCAKNATGMSKKLYFDSITMA